MRRYLAIGLGAAYLALGPFGCSCGGSSDGEDPDAGLPPEDAAPDAEADAGEDDAGTDGGVEYPQDPERCGDRPPAFDVAAEDPFAAERYEDPSPDLVPPFTACEEAFAEQAARRTPCGDVEDRSTFVVTPDADDPRWRSGGFAARFDTIQSAIDAASHCDTIVVRPGTYRENLRIEGKDVQIFSDRFDEEGAVEDGDERVPDYEAERIDLLRYYETGERVVTGTHRTYLRPLRRALRTVLEGGGFEEGPTLGGTIEVDPDDPDDRNRGCGNRRPMVDFGAGTTRNTILDGFTVRQMPQQDHTIPGHGHTLQCRGGSPIIRHNVIHHNGSTGVGVHASWVDTEPVTPPCVHEPALEQETFRNGDFRHTNIALRPVPLVYDNIVYQNNGLGLGNNHYSCAAMVNNESFWNAVPGEEATHQSPGIGVRHGAKPLVEYGIVYENAWGGITVHQGFLQPEDDCEEDPVGCNHIDERTQAVVLHNIVFRNGSDEGDPGSQGGIGLDGVGLPDEPVLVEGNVVFESRVSGIGVRNDYAGEDRGFVMDDTYALVAFNRSFGQPGAAGIVCRGSDHGTSHCTFVGNDAYWNRGGIAFATGSDGSGLHNVVSCNSEGGLSASDGGDDIALLNNIAYFNVVAGISPGTSFYDYNLLSGNNGQPATCDAPSCTRPQYVGSAPGPDDLFADPMFTDGASFDFTLEAGSPAIDSGTDVSDRYPDWPTAGAGPDRGSHERQ